MERDGAVANLEAERRDDADQTRQKMDELSRKLASARQTVQFLELEVNQLQALVGAPTGVPATQPADATEPASPATPAALATQPAEPGAVASAIPGTPAAEEDDPELKQLTAE